MAGSRLRTVLAQIEALAGAQGPSASRPCAFVVDDHGDTREMVAEALDQAGMRVCEIATAAEAIPLLRGVLPDLIVIDLVMPGLSGFALIENLRAHALDVPVIAVTGRGDLDADARAKFDAVLIKPVDTTLLAARAMSLARRRER